MHFLNFFHSCLIFLIFILVMLHTFHLLLLTIDVFILHIHHVLHRLLYHCLLDNSIPRHRQLGSTDVPLSQVGWADVLIHLLILIVLNLVFLKDFLILDYFFHVWLFMLGISLQSLLWLWLIHMGLTLVALIRVKMVLTKWVAIPDLTIKSKSLVLLSV